MESSGTEESLFGANEGLCSRSCLVRVRLPGARERVGLTRRGTQRLAAPVVNRLFLYHCFWRGNGLSDERRRPSRFPQLCAPRPCAPGPLAADLTAAGHACWLDTSDIPGGEAWATAIAEGIDQAYGFVTLVTRESAWTILYRRRPGAAHARSRRAKSWSSSASASSDDALDVTVVALKPNTHEAVSLLAIRRNVPRSRINGLKVRAEPGEP